MACGSICCGHLSDRSRKRLLSRVDSTEIEPEHRLRTQVIGTALCPVGVLLYAWLGHFGIGAPGVIVGVAICASYLLSALPFFYASQSDARICLSVRRILIVVDDVNEQHVPNTRPTASSCHRDGAKRALDEPQRRRGDGDRCAAHQG